MTYRSFKTRPIRSAAGPSHVGGWAEVDLFANCWLDGAHNQLVSVFTADVGRSATLPGRQREVCKKMPRKNAERCQKHRSHPGDVGLGYGIFI